MDFPSIKWVREQSDSTGPQESSPAAPSADAATFERQLSEIANSNGGGGAMPAASALQPAQSTGVLIGRSKQPLYSEDARLISGLEEALRNGNAANQTVYGYVSSLRSFGRWLFANNKDPIAARLDDQSLTDDAREAIEKGHNKRLRPAIDHLRTFQSTGGVVPITGRSELNPPPQDVALIKEYKNEAATGTGKRHASVLRSFSDYLRKSSKPGIAARLSGNTLDEDVKRYRKDAGGDPNIGAALADLRKSQAGAKAMELERHISPVPDPEDAALMEPWRVGDAAAQHSAPQGAVSQPLVLPEGYDQDLLWELMDEPGPSSSLEPAARHDQSSDPGESIHPLNWGYDRQQFLDEPMGALARSNLPPSEEVLINDEHDAAELRPAKRPRTLDNLHGLASERQLSEIANSGGGGGAMPAASALQPAQSAGVLIGRQSKQPLYSEDARLISGLEEALRNGNAANQTAYAYVSSLRSFGRWLFANNKDPIAARLDDQSLTDDAREAIEKGHNRRLRPAIDHLRTFQSTGGAVPITGRSDLNPPPQDVALIEEYKNEAATGTSKTYAFSLRSFSDYLRENNKKGIAGRLSGNTLDEDVERYRKDAGGNRTIGAALADLRKSQAGAKAMERERHIFPVPDLEDAALMEPGPVGDAAAQHSASQDAGSWPEEVLPVEGYDQDLLWELMDEPGPSSSLEPAARHDQSSDPGETIRPLNWGYDRQQFLDEPMAALARSNLLPSEEVLINDEHDTAELRPAKRPRTLDNLHGLAGERQLSEIANSGGGGGAMPAASALQPAQSAGVLIGRSKEPLYSEDARLISGLEEALRNGNAANQTAHGYVSSLRSFGRWLFANNKDPIAARLDDQSLTDDAREAIEKGHHRKLRPAIDHLRTFQSTGGGAVPITGRAELNPHPQDVALIEEYKNEAATGTGRMYAAVLRSFSDYLRENNKKGIAGRLSGNTLDEDVKRYRKDAGVGGNRNIGAALADLRKSQAGAKAMERERHISPVPDPEDAALMEPGPVGGAAAQHSASQDAGSWPKKRLPAEGYDQDLLLGLMDEPGPSSSLEPAARHDQSSDPGETIRPLNWGYDRQQFLDEPMAALARSNLLPSEEVLINDEHDTAELRPAKRPRTLDNLHGLAGERQLSEIANSGGRLLTSVAPTHQQGASPWQAQPMMQASGHEDATAPHAVATYVGGAPAHSAPQGGYDQDLPLMVEDGPPWSGVPPEQAQEIVQAREQEPARSTSTWSPQMPLNFDWSMWPTLEAASAHSARAPSDIEGGLEAAVHPNPPAPFELRDNAWSPAPDFPPPFAGPVPGHHQGVRQPGSPQGLSPAPAFSDDEALAWLREELARRQMQEPASPSTSRAPSDTYGGLESFVDLDAPTSSESRDDAHFEPAPAAKSRSDTYGGLESFVDLDAPPPSELRDDAHFEPAPAARSRSDTYRGFPLVDLTAPTPSESRDDANSVRPFPSTSADAQIGALGPTASSHGRGLVLEDTEWLGDEHIDRDYRLQEQDLQRYHPDLAARTRFVNPLIVLNYLRSNDDGVVRTEFQRIVYDNGNDTADFLFLPVINADPQDPNSLGNHWSLLFVDRRDRGRPVAYHYDSYGGLNHKDAEHLAGRLDLRLEPAGMARQRNGYDCGVFVVDGTRALVRQLEQGREPDLLNLSNLVANRQALQNRLRG
ncbi:Ulp1 family isopeptidase [Bradyrhizobium sp. 2S1]|uniref:Ulp1 family isopeptidase n=1 Tax=Bradyrhizobium sp. 2S1 TaxID=1404429 RepID=UPI001CD17A5C|nr:Ulp1 family isopeptidase [Bradyrhizobium sp. 2S1]MCK7670069.1 Ulp1 family isopeptidase [Bradyrhizobium sp. 2S1]